MTRLLISSLAVCFTAACSSGGNDIAVTPEPTPAPTPPASVNFTTFVKEQIQATDEKSEPVDINELDFAFTDDENPEAFDDVLGLSDGG